MLGSTYLKAGATTLAAAALAATATQASAAKPAAGARVAMVHYDDLDLSTGKGRDGLESRVKRAARKVCSEPGRDLAMNMRARQCYKTAMQKVRPQLDLAFTAHKAGQAQAFNQIEVQVPGR